MFAIWRTTKTRVQGASPAHLRIDIGECHCEIMMRCSRWVQHVQQNDIKFRTALVAWSAQAPPSGDSCTCTLQKKNEGRNEGRDGSCSSHNQPRSSTSQQRLHARVHRIVREVHELQGAQHAILKSACEPIDPIITDQVAAQVEDLQVA
mmetsp:Transcript_6162/g.13637  ORF Transcript_6162/g.13637 Transcript_6162/m.13637 type:complete len:149 (+) Transcript_6162:236-682(+)